MKSLNFKLNQTIYLKLSSFLPIRSLGSLYWVKIELIFGSKKYSIYDKSTGDGLHMVCESLKKVLANKSCITIPNNQDLGYLYNEYLNLPDSVYFKTEWFAEHTWLWFFGGRKFQTITHLYNNADGNIVLHVSKNCYWRGIEKGDKNYVSYKEFMKNYKPLYVGTISRKVAQKLLARFERLHTRVWENQRRYDEDCAAATKEGTVCKWCVRDEKYRKALRAKHTLKVKKNSKKPSSS